MSKKRVKQYLMLLTVIGLVSVASGSGTFASFSAEVSNTGNTFASGTLFLHETGKDSTGASITQCNSESGALNVNNTCQVLFNNVDLSQGAATVDVALNNAGTINASDIKMSVPSCSWGDNFAVTNTHTTFISPPANCNGVYFTVQETGATYAVPSTDVYCALGPSSVPHRDCGAPDNTRTLGGTSSLTTLLTAGGVTAPLATTATKYYVIKVDPSGVGTNNQLQNLALTFSLTFHLDQ